MAVDYPISGACLLDELMDNEVISCDIDFGSTASVFAVKGSPSHESDSGCSDMSDDRSVSPGFSHGEVGFPELDDLNCNSLATDLDDNLECDSLTTDLDEELQSYLNAPFKVVGEKPEVGTSNVVRPMVATVLPSSPEIEVDSDSDPEYEPPKGKKVSRMPPVVHTKTKRYIPTPAPKADICVLPSKSRDKVGPQPGQSTDKNNNSSVRPAVKVVKVIKTPATSAEDVGNQLMQALDERNKKNAKQAKINREKKKVYIKSLEDEIESLRTENVTLKMQQENSESEKKALVEEIDYLKSVLANQSALSGLLKNIGNVKGVNLSSSFSRKRSADMDHDYHSSQKHRKVSKAGVCLHVDDGNVSLEFCSKCAKMAKSTGSDMEDNS